MKPHISIIAAVARNRVIGKQGALAWYLPADLRHFKALTMGHPIVMGRKTHESIGKALPGRQNIVITNSKNYEAPGCTVVDSFERAIAELGGEETFIIGGAIIYEQALPVADRLYITHVDAAIAGDVYFPQVNWNEWQQISNEPHQADEKNTYNYTFTVYQRQ